MMGRHLTVGASYALIEQTIYHGATMCAECWVKKLCCFEMMWSWLLHYGEHKLLATDSSKPAYQTLR